MHFTLKQIRYFVAVADCGSVHSAAARVHVSAASISSAIQQLESQLDLQLFIRHHSKGMTLTSDGTNLLEQARNILNATLQFESISAELSHEFAGNYRLACLPPLAPVLLPGLLSEFKSGYPKVRLQLSEAHQAEIIRGMIQGRFDFALTYQMGMTDALDFSPLATLPPYVVLPATHALSTQASVTIQQLIDEPFVMLDLPLSRDYFASLFKKAQLSANIAWETTQPDVMRGLIASGHGWGIANVKPMNFRSADGNKLAYIKLKGDYPALTLGVATLSSRQKTRTMQAFIDYCVSRVDTSGLPGMLAD
ncbi:MAG: LysR family transcriptional regulator [Pseudomonadota bacterium]